MKRLTWVVLGVLVMSLNGARAWEILPGKTSVWALAASDDETRLIVNLHDAGYWLSEDGGVTWTGISPQVNPLNRVRRSTGLVALDSHADTLLATSLLNAYPDQTVYRYPFSHSMDGGRGWEFTSEPLTNGPSSCALLADYSDHEVLFHLDGDRFRRSLDFGETWTQLAALNSLQWGPYSVTQSPWNPNTLYSVGDHSASMQSNGVIVSHNRGETWAPAFPADQFFPQADIVSITSASFLSNGDLLACVPGISYYDLPDALLRFTGEGWMDEYPFHPGSYPMDLVEIPLMPGKLYFWSEPQHEEQARRVQVSGDYGHTTNPMRDPWGDELLNTVSMTVNDRTNTVYATTLGNGAWKTTSLGATWDELPMPPVSTRSRTHITADYVSWAPEYGQNVYLRRDDEDRVEELRYPVTAVDSSQAACPLIDVQGDQLTGLMLRVAKLPQEMGWMYVMRSEDGGQSWLDPTQALPISGIHNRTRVSFCRDGAVEYVIVRSGQLTPQQAAVYLSADGGQSWRTVDLPDDLFPATIARYLVRDGYLYAIHMHKDIMRRSLEGGDWEALGHPVPDYIKDPDAVYLDPNGLEIYTFTSVYAYVWTGTVWQQRGLLPYPEITSVAALPQDAEEPLFAVSSDETPVVYLSDDGGVEWFAAPNQPLHQDQISHVDEVFYDAYRDRIWLNSPLGVMWADATAFTSVKDGGRDVIPVAHQLLAVYPNPFNGQARVEFALDRPETVTLTVINLLGQEVATLLDAAEFTAGTHTVSLDASPLASGTYFLRLTTARGTAATRKIDLVR